MVKNMGNADRVGRILIATAIAILFFTGVISGTLAWVLIVVGGIFFITSVAGFCPLYTLLGINTCRRS